MWAFAGVLVVDVSSHAVLSSQHEHATFNSKGSIFHFCEHSCNWHLGVVQCCEHFRKLYICELEASVCWANSPESYA